MAKLFYKSKVQLLWKAWMSLNSEVRLYTTDEQSYLVASIEATDEIGTVVMSFEGNENGSVLAPGRCAIEIYSEGAIVSKMMLDLWLTREASDGVTATDVDALAPFVVVDAYQIAREEGFTGSRAEWLESLKEPAKEAKQEVEASLEELRALASDVEAVAMIAEEQEKERQANEQAREAAATELYNSTVEKVDDKLMTIESGVSGVVEVKLGALSTATDGAIASLNERVNAKLTEVDGKMSSVDEQMQSVSSDITALTESVNTQVSTKLTELTTSTNNAVTSLNDRGDAKIAEVDSKLQEIATYKEQLHTIRIEGSKLIID